MFFIQRQLSEKPCGHGTEMLAYFYLKGQANHTGSFGAF
jgi:hypothetical protein